ncbi:DUF397 domain-containing protein [Nocardiopsis coralliicola]
MQHTAHPLWRKSSYSTAQSSCVEVADLPAGHHAIRDSKNPHLAALAFPTREWQAFLNHVTTNDPTYRVI